MSVGRVRVQAAGSTVAATGRVVQQMASPAPQSSSLLTLLSDEISLQLAAVNLMEIITDRLVSPAHTPLQRIHHTHVHDGPDVREVPLSDPEVKRTERFAGDDPGAVIEISKPFLQVMINLGTEGEIVDEHNS